MSTREARIPMKPYLIRAIREWAIDNGFTPQLLVDTNHVNVNVPEKFAAEGRIVLNIHDQAVQGLEMSNEWILFNARFAGRVHQVDIPVDAVVGIFSRETQQGMTFSPAPPRDPGDSGEQDADDIEQLGVEMKHGKPHLRIVR